MTNYAVIKNETENTKAGQSNTYGICAFMFSGGLIDIVNCVYGISDDLDWLKSLADKLNQNDADPIHLCDIIEDELYNVRA